MMGIRQCVTVLKNAATNGTATKYQLGHIRIQFQSIKYKNQQNDR